MVSSLEEITSKLVKQLQQGGQSQQQNSKQLEHLQQLQHFFDQQQSQQQQQKQQQGGQQQAGSVKVYTGPKDGKFIINKHGKKVYIDRNTLNANLQYKKAKKAVKKVKKARK
jgi:peroxiredoxin